MSSSVNKLENAINSSTIQVVDSNFDGDLYIEDESHKMLVAFEGGHIQTKNFNSNKIVKTIDSSFNGDLYIEDESGNSIVAFSNGHIRTKYFDSANIDLSEYAKKSDIPDIPDYFKVSRFNGKRLAIIGDSISTYSGTMPSGYSVYYPKGDVNSVDKMWWYKVCQKLGMTYVNTSWSGSRVSGEPKGSTATAGCSDKRIQDVGRLGAPDIIICYISCNDWANNVILGTWQTSDSIDQNISTTISELRYAYALMLYKLSISYPRAKVFCCSNLDDTSRDRVSGWPSNNNNGVSTYEWNKNIKEVSEALGAIFIDLHACGINYMNVRSLCVDSGLHPNAEGHQMMADYITAQIIANY